MMAYARILVHLDTNDGLHEHITLHWRNHSRQQKLDYEGVPFRCRRCHKVGHLFRDCPLNSKAKSRESSKAIPTKEPQAQREHPPLKMQRFMQTVNQLRRPLQRRPRRSAARHLIVLPLLHSPGQWVLRCLRGAKLSCRFTIQRSCGQGHLADLGTKGWFTFPVLPPAVYEHYRLGQFMDITD